MPSDFTFDIYADLIDAGPEAGYEFLAVREDLASETLPERFVILRHDVDRKPENALARAILMAEHRVTSTDHFRTVEKTFRSERIRTTERLGLEPGYHSEDVDRTERDVEAAHDSFPTPLAHLCEHATTAGRGIDATA